MEKSNENCFCTAFGYILELYFESDNFLPQTTFRTLILGCVWIECQLNSLWQLKNKHLVESNQNIEAFIEIQVNKNKLK